MNDRIADLEALDAGWDSHDGEPPTKAAIERVRGFDRALAYVPTCDGGVQIEYHALGLHFEAVILPSGEVGETFLSTEPKSAEPDPQPPAEPDQQVTVMLSRIDALHFIQGERSGKVTVQKAVKAAPTDTPSTHDAPSVPDQPKLAEPVAKALDDHIAKRRWRVGQIVRHRIGSEWELIEHLGGQADDWRARCITSRTDGAGRLGQVRTFHREYMDRSFTVIAPRSQPNQQDVAAQPSEEEADQSLAKVVDGIERETLRELGERLLSEEANHAVAQIIAASLRQREDQIRNGTMGDRQTETPNGIAARVLEAVADALNAAASPLPDCTDSQDSEEKR